MNNYPIRTYLFILIIVFISIAFALPNIFSADPAIQISGQSGEMEINQSVMDDITTALKDADIDYFGTKVDGETGILRLTDIDQQLYAKQVIQKKLGLEYVVALNLAPTTPEWLTRFGASPMKLGLDLRGGVHFLLEVNTDEAISKQMDTIVRQVRTAMREEKLRYESIKLVKRKQIVAAFKTKTDADKANSIIRQKFTGITRDINEENGLFIIRSKMSEPEIKKIQDYAINQNLTTLRNRVNELGVSEPVVQRQGKNRIVVELPGVQDTAAAKRIIGKTANLEFRLEAKPGSSNREKFSFSDSYVRDRGIKDAYLKRTVVITGDHVSKASAGYDEKGTPNVNISLNSQGGARMHRMTRNNIGQRLGVLFIEYKVRTKYNIDSDGKKIAISERYVEKKIINLATIQSALGVGFQITGLSTPREASELALFLRAGAMAAPMYFVEERTIGPSLGAENIVLGVKSVSIGMFLVVIFMLLYYKIFGLFANIALTLNLLILVAFMSMLEATLTLPGIAGIVLTVGIAVDANVLIFSRIKEEISNGLPPQSAISAGYDRAFVSIVDANVTTLIVAVILFIIGSGPVQGFAVTLSIGILVSMFTAIIVTRALVNLSFGNRSIEKLRI
ncbi:MAG: protein translocase subunit SecD [Gammaproteobacteria bacterium]|jgi:preprotein translocase subunit SecD|nr:protein translocase subunit SecD [Gammaproteobacteria bacterium]MDA7736934.1 protein translocase subunit SecD [Porticoccus sp.]MDC0412398.1 protein translocase subunit SecD [Porticoccus sp.]MDC0888151.1 protein translocase subunit SecD [Porticoccus sp.]MDC1093725.1 protein translocase subunit SecD [Porticoccus sp.]